MEIIQGAHNFGRVEEGGGIVEAPGAPKVAEQLPAADVGEQHVEEALVLGAPAQVDQERVVYLLKKSKNYFFLTQKVQCLTETKLQLLLNLDILCHRNLCRKLNKT